MIILTGGAGFIGTNLLIELNNRGYTDIVLVDNISTTEKWRNLVGRQFLEYVHKDSFWSWLESSTDINIEAIFHLGACSDTMEQNFDYLYINNVVYSQKLWAIAADRDIPFFYASSAATYGDGSQGFSDNHSTIGSLKPLNGYGMSKQLFDLWVLKQTNQPPNWVGLKFFNVFGPYEDHKGRMASVLWHFNKQINSDKKIELFSGSHGFGDGEQRRDFIYVKDAVDMMMFIFKNKVESGLYNIGTGISTTFNELARIFTKSNKMMKIEYIPFPEDLLEFYQPDTKANILKIHSAGYKYKFDLAGSIHDYLRYLL